MHRNPQVKIKSFKQENNFIKIELSGLSPEKRLHMLKELIDAPTVSFVSDIYFLDHFLVLPRQEVMKFLGTKTIENIFLKFGVRAEDYKKLQQEIQPLLADKKPVPEKILIPDDKAQPKAYFQGKEFKKPNAEQKQQPPKDFLPLQETELTENEFAHLMAIQYPLDKFAKLLANISSDSAAECFFKLKTAQLPHDYKKSVAMLLLAKCGKLSWSHDKLVITGNIDAMQSELAKAEKLGPSTYYDTWKNLFEILCQFDCTRATEIAACLLTQQTYELPAGYHGAIVSAAQYDQLALLEFFVTHLKNKYQENFLLHMNLDFALITASQAGHLRIVNYLCDIALKSKFDTCASFYFSRALAAAAGAGQLAVCQALHKLGAATVCSKRFTGEPFPADFREGDICVFDAFHRAKVANQKEVMNWLAYTCGIDLGKPTLIEQLEASKPTQRSGLDRAIARAFS